MDMRMTPADPRKDGMRDRFEQDVDLRSADPEFFSRPQINRNAAPPPVVDEKTERGEGLRP